MNGSLFVFIFFVFFLQALLCGSTLESWRWSIREGIDFFPHKPSPRGEQRVVGPREAASFYSFFILYCHCRFSFFPPDGINVSISILVWWWRNNARPIDEVFPFREERGKTGKGILAGKEVSILLGIR